jgi:hypothetical protein
MVFVQLDKLIGFVLRCVDQDSQKYTLEVPKENMASKEEVIIYLYLFLKASSAKAV